MTDRGLSLASLPVVTILLSALALGLVFLGRYWGLGLSTLYLLAVPIALAFAYLAWYRTLPYEPAHPRPRADSFPGSEEPFVDPVEEADEWARTKDGGQPPEEPTDEPEEISPEPPAPP